MDIALYTDDDESSLDREGLRQNFRDRQRRIGDLRNLLKDNKIANSSQIRAEIHAQEFLQELTRRDLLDTYTPCAMYVAPNG